MTNLDNEVQGAVPNSLDSSMKAAIITTIGWNVAKAVGITLAIFTLNKDDSFSVNTGLSAALIAADLVSSPSVYVGIACIGAVSYRRIRGVLSKGGIICA